MLRVDGQDVATLRIPHTIAFLMVADETFDVGVDTRTPVNDKDYQVPFRFTGTINKVTFNLAVVEIGTGIVLMLDPAIVLALLLGMNGSGEGTSLGRFLGMALLALGLACSPSQQCRCATRRCGAVASLDVARRATDQGDQQVKIAI